MGWSLPAAIGATFAKDSCDKRSIVFIGDGAYNMSGSELSTLYRSGSNAIIILLNNAGYATERPMLDGPWNDTPHINYFLFPYTMSKSFDPNVLANIDADANATEPTSPESISLLLSEAKIASSKNLKSNNSRESMVKPSEDKFVSTQCKTIQSFKNALNTASKMTDYLHFIEVILPKNGKSNALQRIAGCLGRDVFDAGGAGVRH